ncbi:MAG: ribosome small subunit-dependent GTPase A [Myxococcales bacterium]|nr:ribosome small subunit-dependent GTPase A [Myxococcales bacterium]HIK84908.1 ribosome small subunit-dependent GTPase A [Myxococcales bacterium]
MAAKRKPSNRKQRRPNSAKENVKGKRSPPPVLTDDEIAHGEPGRVVAHHGVAVLVRFDSGAERQIWLLPEQRAVAGDCVVVARDRLVVMPAEGVLRRLDARGRERTIATNLDVLGIVIAPEPREPPGYIDRGFVIARAAGIRPMLILNKTDLPGASPLAEKLTEIYGASCEICLASAISGQGVAELSRSIAAGKLGALVGPSGVGKSSLLNALVPDLDLRVSALNRGSQKGRHTTTTATVHDLPDGGLLVDTAGFKDFIAVDLDAHEAAQFFPGFETALEAGCRFRDCLHRSEPECGVLAAIEEGIVDERRHQSYVQLLDELAALDESPKRSR